MEVEFLVKNMIVYDDTKISASIRSETIIDNFNSLNEGRA